MIDRTAAQLLYKAEQEGISKFAVGAYVSDDTGDRVLLLRRAPDEFLAGMYEIPSGAVEEGEGLKDALIREVKEETRLDVSEVIGYVNYVDYKDESGEITRQYNYAVRADSTEDVVLSAEHDWYRWVTQRDLRLLDLDEFARSVTTEFFAWRHL